MVFTKVRMFLGRGKAASNAARETMTLAKIGSSLSTLVGFWMPDTTKLTGRPAGVVITKGLPTPT